MSAYKYTQQEMDDLIADIREGRNEVEALQAENKRLREVLELHNEVIDALWDGVHHERHLEEVVEDAWVKYKEVMGDVPVVENER